MGGEPSGQVESHRGAVVLVLGILGLIVCPIIGIIAWVMGNTDLQKMQAGQMDREGEGLTKAGKICGMISVILAIVMILIWILIMVIGGIGAVAA